MRAYSPLKCTDQGQHAQKYSTGLLSAGDGHYTQGKWLTAQHSDSSSMMKMACRVWDSSPSALRRPVADDIWKRGESVRRLNLLTSVNSSRAISLPNNQLPEKDTKLQQTCE